MTTPTRVTSPPHQACAGRARGADELLPLVYDRLRRRATTLMRRERADHTLEPAALVHEVYLKLSVQRAARWTSRAHFYAVAARELRRVLIDHARARVATKRGGDWTKHHISEACPAICTESEDHIALSEALDRLARENRKRARVVLLHFFDGLTLAETATSLGINARTAERHWHDARTWLRRELAQVPT
jgi:RNA polymerase sigma-70 factor (ECF subfamily)